MKLDDLNDLIQQCGYHGLFSPTSLDDVRQTLSIISRTECPCDESGHLSALHDLAHDDVPVLLRVIEHLYRRVEHLESAEGARGSVIASQAL